MPCGIWDLSFKIRDDEPRFTSVKAPSPNHRTARVFHQEPEIKRIKTTVIYERRYGDFWVTDRCFGNTVLVMVQGEL